MQSRSPKKREAFTSDNHDSVSILRIEKSTKVASHWQGAMWKIFACLCFAAVNGVVRYISGGTGAMENPLAPYQIVLLQNIFGSLIMIPWIVRKGGLISLRTKRPVLHIVRVISAVLGVILWYFSLSYMNIATAVALAFTGPIFTILGAKMYLGEHIGTKRMVAISIAFVGTFLIMRPDRVLLSPSANMDLTVFLPLLSAIFIAISKLTARDLGASGEAPRVLTAYLLFLMVPVSAIPAFIGWVNPTLHQWGWLVVLGALGTLAHLSTAKALSLAGVTFLNPFGFSRLVLSGFIGFMAFNEIPNSANFWIGLSVIIFSVTLMMWDTKDRLGRGVDI